MFYYIYIILAVLLLLHQSITVQHIDLEPLQIYHINCEQLGDTICGINLYLTSQPVNPLTTNIVINNWYQINKKKFNIIVTEDRSVHRLILLLLSGIEPNPGPRTPRFPCTVCKKACKDGTIACDNCDKWTHKSCIGMSTTLFNDLNNTDSPWTCPSCSKPNISTSRIYLVPTAPTTSTNNPSINLSTHPSLIDSIDEISIPSTSQSCITSPSYNNTSSFQSAGTPIMTSSPKSQRPTPEKRKFLRILNINFQSLSKKGKLLEVLIDSTDPDIILGTETWLDSNIKSSEIIPEEMKYDIERRDRPTDPHGGVLIAAKQQLQLGNIIKSKDIELISGTINLEGNKKMHIAAFYRPPNRTDDEYTNKASNEISDIKAKAKKNIILVGGDYNLPDIDWTNQTITNNQYPTKTNQAYLNIVADNGFEQIVDFPTRKDNTLDLMLTSHPAYKQRCKPLPSIGNSDHDIVLLDIACKPYKPKPTRRKILLWKNADLHNIKEDLENFKTSFIQTTYQNIETMWEAFKTAIEKTMERRVPSKLSSARYTHPWINTRIRKKIKRKQKAYNKAKKTKKKRDKDRFKRLKQETQWEIRQANKKIYGGCQLRLSIELKKILVIH